MNTKINNDEQYWLEQFRNGDSLAFAHYFDQHSRSLAYFSNNIINDQGEAEDIVSKCFMKLWNKRTDFSTSQNIKAFLFISCRNACLDYLQSLKLKTKGQEQYLHYLQTTTEDVFYEVIQTDILDLVHQEIDGLPEKMRNIFKLLYIEGKTTSEIAGDLGLSVQTVRNQKTKAIEIIKTSLVKKKVSTLLQFAILLYFSGK